MTYLLNTGKWQLYERFDNTSVKYTVCAKNYRDEKHVYKYTINKKNVIIHRRHDALAGTAAAANTTTTTILNSLLDDICCLAGVCNNARD